MSALPPKADIRRRYCDVRFVPKADIRPTRLFDHLVGGYKQRLWYCEVESLGGLSVDDKFEGRWLQHRKISWPCSFEYACNVDSALSEDID